DVVQVYQAQAACADVACRMQQQVVEQRGPRGVGLQAGPGIAGADLFGDVDDRYRQPFADARVQFDIDRGVAMFAQYRRWRSRYRFEYAMPPTVERRHVADLLDQPGCDI